MYVYTILCSQCYKMCTEANLCNHYLANNYDVFNLCTDTWIKWSVSFIYDHVYIHVPHSSPPPSPPPQIDALPRVVEAVAGACEVYVDGGFRTASDILKGLALGARAIFLGRPVSFALAYNVST